MEETIHGTTMPVLELSLADGESIVSEAGEFSWMSDAVQMATNTGGGMGGKGLMGAVKRAVSGASIMMTTYTAQGGAGSIAFASKFPGHILPIDVAPGNEFMVHRHGFMAATPGVELPGSEYPLEAFYSIQATPWWDVRPDVQYIVHPGGYASARDEVQIGVRTDVKF